MVAKVLVNEDIDGGKLLIEALDREKVPVSSAYWLYEPESERYRLCLATELYDRLGPLEAYRAIQRVLDKVPEESKPLLIDINVVSPSDNITQSLAIAIKTGQGISSIRFSRSNIGGIFIEDALIYRLN